MKKVKPVLAAIFLLTVYACARPIDQDASQKPGATPQPTPVRGTPRSKVGKLEFPVYSKEQQVQVKSLKAADALPITTERDYLLLRGGGIRVPRGQYFIRPLADPKGGYSHFLFCQKRDTNPADVDIETAKAKDGSFAEILDVVAAVAFANPFQDTVAHTSSSGESGAVWFHYKGEKVEYRGELMGYAGPSAGLKKTQ